MDNAVIATAIERGIAGQSELVTSLSLALIGGLLFFMLQLKMHNVDNPTSRVAMHRFWCFVVSLSLAGLAILSGFFVSGMLIEVAPIFFSHEFISSVKFSDQDIKGAPIAWLRCLSISQAFLFLSSVVFGTLAMVRNRP